MSKGTGTSFNRYFSCFKITSKFSDNSFQEEISEWTAT